MKGLISGCSYSCGTKSYGATLKEMGYDISNLSHPGLSNNHIIYKIYEYVTKHNVENSFIILQITWLHRLGLYSSYFQKWINYQPNALNVIPTYDEESNFVNFEVDFKNPLISEMYNKNINKNNTINQMLKMYSSYIEHHYNEKETFNYLLYQIDTLVSYVEKKNNKILLMYWPEINNDYELEELKKRNFFNLENEYSILKWSTKYKFLNIESSHLSIDGHAKIAEELNKFLLKQEKNHKINLI